MTFVNLVANAVSERARERRESLGKAWMRPNTDLTLFNEDGYMNEKPDVRGWMQTCIQGVQGGSMGCSPTFGPQMSQPDMGC